MDKIRIDPRQIEDDPAILDCAVVGVADPDGGKRVSAALVLEEELETDALPDWAVRALQAPEPSASRSCRATP